MATKKVLVEIEVKQKGKAVPEVKKGIDDLTSAQKKYNRALQDNIDAHSDYSESTQKMKKESSETRRQLTLEESNTIKLAKAKERLAFEQSDLGKEYAKVTVQAKVQSLANQKLAVSQMETTESTHLATDAMKEMKTTAGLSGAIVTEFGRTISDLPYGIRGVGNNISQLASLFGLLSVNVAKSGRTMKDGLLEVVGQLKGAVGILTAFQIVLAGFQSGVIQRFLKDLFTTNGALKVFNELIKQASENAGNSVGNFKIYTSILQDSNSSLREQNEALKSLNKEYPDFNASILLDKKNTELADEARKQYIKTLKQQAISQAAMSEFQESESKIIEKQLERESSAREAGFNSFEEVQTKLEKELERINKIQSERRKTREKDALIGLQRIVNIGKDEIKEEEDKQEILLNLINIRGEKQRNQTESTKKVFKEGLLDLSKLEERFRQESLKSEIKTEEELIQEKEDFAKKDLELTLTVFKEKEELKLKQYLSSKNLTDQQIIDAKKASKDTINSAKEEAKGVIEQIEAVSDAERTLLTRREAERARAQQEEIDKRKRAINIDTASDGIVGTSDNRADAIQAEIEYQKLLLDATTKGTIERFNAEQAYYEARKMLAEEDLVQENIIIEQKKNTNQQYLDFMSIISSGLQAIDSKNKEWQKASLLFEKSIAIGGVVSEAAKSIAISTAATQAANQLIIAKYAAVPAGAVLAGKEMAANTAFYRKGVVQTKTSAATSIASILSGTISGLSSINNSGGSSGGNSGGGDVQPPDFNIIGSTGVNQLAEAIGSTEKKPQRAYVVTSDITTQQALDRNTRDSAEL